MIKLNILIFPVKIVGLFDVFTQIAKSELRGDVSGFVTMKFLRSFFYRQGNGLAVSVRRQGSIIQHLHLLIKDKFRFSCLPRTAPAKKGFDVRLCIED